MAVLRVCTQRKMHEKQARHTRRGDQPISERDGCAVGGGREGGGGTSKPLVLLLLLKVGAPPLCIGPHALPLYCYLCPELL